jgi:hypothetical protein
LTNDYLQGREITPGDEWEYYSAKAAIYQHRQNSGELGSKTLKRIINAGESAQDLVDPLEI